MKVSRKKLEEKKVSVGAKDDIHSTSPEKEISANTNFIQHILLDLRHKMHLQIAHRQSTLHRFVTALGVPRITLSSRCRVGISALVSFDRRLCIPPL